MRELCCANHVHKAKSADSVRVILKPPRYTHNCTCTYIEHALNIEQVNLRQI